MDETTAEPAEGSVGMGGDWEPVPDETPVDPPVEDAPEEDPETTPADEIEIIAKEVIAGHWGRGQDRNKRLKEAGYDPVAVNFAMIRVFNR